jgi:predicted ArsR family transcriptional regulator
LDTSHPSVVLAGDDRPPAGGPSPEELKSSRRAAGGSGEDRTLAEYAERLAGLLTNAGFPRMPARVLMVLMVADVDGLTASDLAQRLDVSAAAISNAVRYLQSVGMIRRVSQPGRRRDRYELPHHAWYTASLDRNPFYDAGIALSEHALSTTDPNHPAVARITEMIDFFRFIERRMPELIAEWRARPRD